MFLGKPVVFSIRCVHLHIDVLRTAIALTLWSYETGSSKYKTGQHY